MANKQRTAKAGIKLGRYRIESELGRGGMGVVYLAIDENLGRRVALKTTSMAVLGSSEQARNQRQARFVREVKALAQVSHENVVHVFDAGEADDPNLGWVLYYTMQFVDGITLAQMVHRLGALDAGAAAAVCMQVAAGLGSAHRGGIVHRDVKPANIFIDKAGRALIGDFGICKLEGSTQITRRDQLVGTPNYLAPEQILGDEITAATDVFALGALFYVIATNSPLRTKVDPSSLLADAQADDSKKKMLATKSIPTTLRKLVAKALERDPKKRFPSCVEFAEALSDHATRIPHFADETREDMKLPQAAGQGLSADTGTNPFAPLPAAENAGLGLAAPTPAEVANFAGSGAAGVEEAALALLKEAGIGGESGAKQTPAPLQEANKASGELPVAQVESTVMFNLRQMEDEESAKQAASVPDDEAPLLEPKAKSGDALPVAKAESTVMFNLRQLEDEHHKNALEAAADGFAISDKTTPQQAALGTENLALDQATDLLSRAKTGPGSDQPLTSSKANDDAQKMAAESEQKAAKAARKAEVKKEKEEKKKKQKEKSKAKKMQALASAPQGSVKRLDLSAVHERLVEADLSAPALYALVVGAGTLVGLIVVLLLSLAGGSTENVPPQVDDASVAENTPAVPALPPKACRAKAKNQKSKRAAKKALARARKDEKAGRHATALQKARAAIVADPQNADAHMMIARLTAVRGEVAKTVAAYECIVFIAPDSDNALLARKALQAFRGQQP